MCFHKTHSLSLCVLLTTFSLKIDVVLTMFSSANTKLLKQSKPSLTLTKLSNSSSQQATFCTNAFLYEWWNGATYYVQCIVVFIANFLCDVLNPSAVRNVNLVFSIDMLNIKLGVRNKCVKLIELNVTWQTTNSKAMPAPWNNGANIE